MTAVLEAEDALTERPGAPPRPASRRRSTRVLALSDWGAIGTLDRRAFERVLDYVWTTPPRRMSTELAATIEQAGWTLVAVVASGALVTARPEVEFSHVPIDVWAATRGFLPFPRPRTRKGVDPESAPAPRQPLLLPARVGVVALVRRRLVDHGARPGDMLLAPLPSTATRLVELAGRDLPWLERISGRPSWPAVLRLWLADLMRRLAVVESDRVTWADVAKQALWWLHDDDALPFVAAVRSRAVRCAGMPEWRLRALPGSTRRTARPRTSNALDRDLGESSVVGEGDDAGPEVAEEALAVDEPESAEPDREGGRRVSAFLRDVHSGDDKRRGLITAGERLAGDLPDGDYRDLVGWVVSRLSGTLARSSAADYGSRVLRVLHALTPTPFVAFTVADISVYFDDYLSPASVRAVRSALKQFDEYRMTVTGTTRFTLDWNAGSLRAFQGYRERAVLTEHEVRVLLDRALGLPHPRAARLHALLVLLRRCGLRVAEAAALRPCDFRGHAQWRLVVPKSKSRAGRGRALPLYLLLDERELEVIRGYVAARLAEGGPAAQLFPARSGATTPHQLGCEASRLLDAFGETPHGLRHGFANALVAAWYLETMRSRGETSRGWARWALEEFCRPEVEGRAVRHLEHVQAMLGHASVETTLEYYVHVADLVAADAVTCVESRSPYLDRPFVGVGRAAELLSVDRHEVSALATPTKEGVSLRGLGRAAESLAARLLA
jgi:integrase